MMMHGLTNVKSILDIEAACYSKTQGSIYQSMWCHIP